MKLGSYSSVAAFIAHRRALTRARAALNGEDRERLAAMDEIEATLRPEERVALDSDDSAAPGSTARRRQFAEFHLARELRARGLLAP